MNKVVKIILIVTGTFVVAGTIAALVARRGSN